MSRLFTDMTGREVAIGGPPIRIVSLVPSQTELLCDLGLDEEVVGITKFCIHPNEWFRNKTRVGGTKTVHLDRVVALQPDLIIANKEENTKEQIEALSEKYPVWISDIRTVNDGLEMIAQIGAITNRKDAAQQLIGEISAGFKSLERTGMNNKVAYYIWKNPWMCAGGDTFISDVIAKMGWQNVLADRVRYPTVGPAELLGSRVTHVLLSSEPYPFKEKDIAEIEVALPGVSVVLVDGEMFSWYGSRMKKAVAYLSDLRDSIEKSIV
jgi:ABC-type Fe3+-hydroxamate transport system substrate-binding protein